MAVLALASVVKWFTPIRDFEGTTYGLLVRGQLWLHVTFSALESLTALAVACLSLRAALALAGVVFSVFLGAGMFTLTQPGVGSCGCLGMWSAGADPLVSTGMSMGISGVLWLGIAGVMLRGTARERVTNKISSHPDGGPEAGMSSIQAGNVLRAGRGFTLLELMVVIGIILVLIALFFVVGVQVRSKSRETLCQSNLRQVGQALTTYAASNKGMIPRYADRGNVEPNWVVETARIMLGGKLTQWEQIPRVSALQCPEHPVADIPSAYVMNVFSFGHEPRWPPAPPTGLGRFRSPATTPLVLESSDKFGDVKAFFDGIYFEFAHVVHQPSHVGQGATTLSRVNLKRHRGGSGVLFADGHVSRIRPEELPLAAFDDGVRWPASTWGFTPP